MITTRKGFSLRGLEMRAPREKGEISFVDLPFFSF